MGTTPSLGRQCLVGRLLGLRQRKEGRAIGHEGAQRRRAGTSLLAGKNKAHPETWAVEASPQK